MAILLLLALPTAQEPRESRRITVEFTGAKYERARGRTSGTFRTGQEADLLLSGIGFDDSGGPLLFNHPMGIAADGTRLLVADTYNNRVLIWNSLPSSNVAPDLVLGQEDFRGNHSGTSLDRMNFPVQVATDGTRVVVADADNHRLLIWDRFPTRNGPPADRILRGGDPRDPLKPSKSRFQWPWGLWTDGVRLAVSSTRDGSVLLWNRFPSREDQPADVLLTGGGRLGTPRTITSDGRCLIVGDHNPKTGTRGGSFFWKNWPTRDDEPYDFFATDPGHPEGAAWLRGCFTQEGRLVLLGSALHVWDEFPKDARDPPALSLRYDFRDGGNVGAVMAGGRLYVCAGNRNTILAFRSLPLAAGQEPDFAIGSPDIRTDTLQGNFIISNPVPASNGESLFVASDFDRRLYVWRSCPGESGAHPDLVYRLPEPPWDVALWRERLALAASRAVYLWKKLPLGGEMPDVVLTGRIGSIPLREARGIAMDDSFFYLSERRQGRIYVWKGIPSADAEPAFSLEAPDVARLSSDGEWLAAAPMTGHSIRLYRVRDLGPGARPETVGGRARETFNLVTDAQVAGGRLFAADSAHHRVLVWNRVEEAIAGRGADAVLGGGPATARDRMRFPAAVCFDGTRLWVGEMKFSERILRFTPCP